MGHPKAEMAEVAARRAQLVRLRLAGVPYDDPRILNLGYSSRNAASKDLVRALEQNRDEEAAAVSVYRQQENERLDALLAAIWDQAVEGDPRAIDTALKLMDRRAKLNGLDMPVKTELSGPDGGSIPLGATLGELNDLINAAGDTGEGDGPTRDLLPGTADDHSD